MDGGYLRGGNRWITTCRILSYNEKELPEDGIPVRIVRPLNPSQINEFVTQWFESMAEAGQFSRTVAGHKARQLQAAAERDQLSELAENPMLLTIMALVQTYHGTLPRENGPKLYQACVETVVSLAAAKGGNRCRFAGCLDEARMYSKRI